MQQPNVLTTLGALRKSPELLGRLGACIVLISSDGFWLPGGKGYTSDPEQAWRLPLSEAFERTKHMNSGEVVIYYTARRLPQQTRFRAAISRLRRRLVATRKELRLAQSANAYLCSDQAMQDLRDNLARTEAERDAAQAEVSHLRAASGRLMRKAMGYVRQRNAARAALRVLAGAVYRARKKAAAYQQAAEAWEADSHRLNGLYVDGLMQIDELRRVSDENWRLYCAAAAKIKALQAAEANAK